MTAGRSAVGVTGVVGLHIQGSWTWDSDNSTCACVFMLLENSYTMYAACPALPSGNLPKLLHICSGPNDMVAAVVAAGRMLCDCDVFDRVSRRIGQSDSSRKV